MNIIRGEALQPHNTLAMQACADAFVTVSNDAQLLAAFAWARTSNMNVVPLGEGSNVVFAGDIKAMVLRQATRGVNLLEAGVSSVRLRVAAGENWHQLVQWTLHQGYYGLENLALIPGTVGAAPIQNIGAYGVELQSVLLQVHARQIANDKLVILDNAECDFGYRDSIFKRELQDQLVLTAIDMVLSLRPTVNITYPSLANYFKEWPSADITPQAVFDAVVSIRRSQLPDPSTQPNAGSFFKNPLLAAALAHELLQKHPALPCYPQGDGRVKLSAAWMIEQCGWKGFQRDGLGVHGQHALVLVNFGNNSGRQLLSLANDIVASVHDNFGVRLEIEPRLYGDSS